MKWFIASDIHGSAYYCRRLIDAYRAEKADRMILLGDILYHGPRNELPLEYSPRDVAEMLNTLKNEIYCVRGNCEAEVDQMVLDFPAMADYMLLPSGGSLVFVTHGHIYNTDNLPPLKDGDVLLHGHTHVPACESVHGITYMNPGSVSLPKEGSWRGYMTCEGSNFVWKDIDGNVMKEFSMIN